LVQASSSTSLPSSHSSLPLVKPSPQSGRRQLVVQLSVFEVLASSHSSSPFLIPSPQVAKMQRLVQSSLPSQASPGPTMPSPQRAAGNIPLVLLLPGSRRQELRRHLPVMVEAAQTLTWKHAVRWRLVVPNDRLRVESQNYTGGMTELETRVGGLAEALSEADVALACSGTVTLECALYGVPTVVMYRTSWPTYFVARQIVQVEYLAMPNLLAGESVYPEFIQGDVTAENVAREALDLLMNTERRVRIQETLRRIVQSLGAPGASQRAAEVLVGLLDHGAHELRGGLR
jgi:lipid-A-disaccharide synthase